MRAAHMGPYGPSWKTFLVNCDQAGTASRDLLLTEFISQIFQKTNNFDGNHKIINKNTKIVNLEILKVKMWFGDKDLFS